MQDFRNCDGESNPGFSVKIFDQVWSRCPLKDDSISYMPVVSIINMCETSGMGGSRVMPNDLLEQAERYFVVRGIVLAEHQRIEKLRERTKNRGE